MSGTNVDTLSLVPGVFKDTTQYAAGSKWFDASLIRWVNDVMTPVGGWVKDFEIATTRPIRDIYSWKDYLKKPYISLGSANALWACSVQDGGIFTKYDITPSGLTWTDEALIGYGSGPYSNGIYGGDLGIINPDVTGQWSMDNWGRTLVAVHSQDGRLVQWDPITPATHAVVVTGAPIDNTLVVVTEEEFVMLLGGKNNPRKVEWCSRRNINDWTSTELNSAGGFELMSNGTIKSAIKVQGGILVLTDTDIHIIEYKGPPNYYGRRKLSDEGGVIGKNSICALPGGGAMWMSSSNFWRYDGGITKMPCSVHNEVFLNSELVRPSRIFMGLNEQFEEVWLFYPSHDSNEADRYAFFSYSNKPYWSVGEMSRSAFHNPVWQNNPISADNASVYSHELGWLDNGSSRAGKVFAETGAFEISMGDNVTRIDRIYQDFSKLEAGSEVPNPQAVTMTFKTKMAPGAPENIIGPIVFNTVKGYTTTRARARQIIFRIDQVEDDYWQLGKVRIRLKPGGKR